MKGGTVRRRLQPCFTNASAISGSILVGLGDDSGTVSGVFGGFAGGRMRPASAHPFPVGMLGVVGQSKATAEMQSAVMSFARQEENQERNGSNGCTKVSPSLISSKSTFPSSSIDSKKNAINALLPGLQLDNLVIVFSKKSPAHLWLGFQ